MNSQVRSSRRSFAVYLAVILSTAMVGCGPIPSMPTDTAVEKEPNNGFAEAQTLSFDTSGSGAVAGLLSGANDFDVFDVGDLQEGQALTVSVQASNCLGQEIIIALFDDNAELVRLSNDLGCLRTGVRAFSQQILRSDRHLLAIAFVDDATAATASYQLQVTITSTDTTHAPREQAVFLNFDGATDIWLGGEFWAELSSFEDAYGRSRARTIAADIVQIVRQDYVGLDVVIFNSYVDLPPASMYTPIHITGNTDDYFGLADSVDWYNDNLEDKAIVFGGNFDYSHWSNSQLAQAIANVTSHELGHLLGLVHTDDNTELMDEATPERFLRQDQDFHRADLTEFPIGYQDPLDLLELILGPIY